jgi:hypothetical protein
MRKLTIAAFAIILGVAVGTAPAYATNGYFSHGYGTHYKGMGGAGVALSLNTLAPATNPASLAFLGNRWDVGLAVFNPNRFYDVIGNPSGFPGTFGLTPGHVESGSSSFFIPSLTTTASASRPSGLSSGSRAGASEASTRSPRTRRTSATTGRATPTVLVSAWAISGTSPPTSRSGRRTRARSG